MKNLKLAEETALTNQVKKYIDFSFKKQSKKVQNKLKISRSIYWQSSQFLYNTCYVVKIKNKQIALLYCNPNEYSTKISSKLIKFDANASKIIKSI